MIETRFSSSRQRPRSKPLLMLAGAVAAVTSLLAAPLALASLKQDMARFSDCPISNPAVSECVLSLTTSGEFKLGGSVVPITKTITIQGGLIPPKLVPAADGNTLSKTPLTVPGGLIGIELLGNFSQVTATAELAGPAEIGTEVVLPLHIKLDNPLLGGNCYLGSTSAPISLHLSYGTTSPPPPNKPITGKAVVTTKDNGAILSIAGTLVDNAFAAPGASGCTLLPLIGDLAVNIKEGLPSAAGKNTAIMTGTTEEANAQIVRAVAPLPDFGRCQKVEGVAEGKKLAYHGAYLTRTCTTESGERTGKYEWTPGPGPNRKFTGTSRALTLETTGGALLICAAGSNEGEYTGPKTERMTLKLTGCALGPKGQGTTCQTSSATPGEIQTTLLQGSLDFIKENEAPATPIVGLSLKPASGPTLAVFECGSTTVSVAGSVIVASSALDKMTAGLKLKATSLAGRQNPEAFEVGAKETLSLTRGSAAPEQAGLTFTGATTGEEQLEIKAVI